MYFSTITLFSSTAGARRLEPQPQWGAGCPTLSGGRPAARSSYPEIDIHICSIVDVCIEDGQVLACPIIICTYIYSIHLQMAQFGVAECASNENHEPTPKNI